MRTTYLPLLFVGLLALVPLSAAQVAPSALMLELRPSDTPATLEEPAVLYGRVEFATSAIAARLETTGITIRLSVIEAPEWATVTLTPSSMVVQLHDSPGSMTAYGVAEFAVLVHANDALGDDLGSLEIEARSIGTQFTAGAQNVADVALTRAAECHHDEPAAGSDEGGDVVLQSASTAPTASATPWVGVALGSVAGVGVGALVRRRFP